MPADTEIDCTAAFISVFPMIAVESKFVSIFIEDGPEGA